MEKEVLVRAQFSKGTQECSGFQTVVPALTPDGLGDTPGPRSRFNPPLQVLSLCQEALATASLQASAFQRPLAAEPSGLVFSAGSWASFRTQ